MNKRASKQATPPPASCAFCKRELAEHEPGVASFTVRGSGSKREGLLACSTCIATVLTFTWEMRRALNFTERRVAIGKRGTSAKENGE